MTRLTNLGKLFIKPREKNSLKSLK